MQSANLLSKKPFEENPLAYKFFYWVIGVGRVVIIFTNLIVLGAFASRWKLDAAIADLSEEIETKKMVLESTKESEATYRDFQDRLAFIKDEINHPKLFSLSLKRVTSLFPEEVSLTGLDLGGKELLVSGASPSPNNFGRLVTNLATSDYLEEVALTSAVFDKKENLYRFTLSLLARKEIYSL